MNNDIKITIIIKDKPNLLANANMAIPTLDFGYITIKGFQIWKSNNLNSRLQDYVNITPPSIKAYLRWNNIVFFESEDKWVEIEQIIYDNYCQRKGNLSNEPFDVDKADREINEMLTK